MLKSEKEVLSCSLSDLLVAYTDEAKAGYPTIMERQESFSENDMHGVAGLLQAGEGLNSAHLHLL